MTFGGSEERLCIAVSVSQLPGKAALLEAAEMAFLGVLEVSEESSPVQAVNQGRLQNKTKPNLADVARYEDWRHL